MLLVVPIEAFQFAYGHSFHSQANSPNRRTRLLSLYFYMLLRAFVVVVGRPPHPHILGWSGKWSQSLENFGNAFDCQFIQ